MLKEWKAILKKPSFIIVMLGVSLIPTYCLNFDILDYTPIQNYYKLKNSKIRHTVQICSKG